MSAHTPGPWSAQRGKGWRHWEIFACDDVETYVAGTNEDNDHEEANARLIAAAPELLEALRAFDQWNYEVKSARVNGESVYDYNDLQHMRAEAERLTDAALAKATGGAK